MNFLSSDPLRLQVRTDYYEQAGLGLSLVASHNAHEEKGAVFRSNFVTDPTSAGITAPTIMAAPTPSPPHSPSQTTMHVGPGEAWAASRGSPKCSGRGQGQL